MILAQLNKVLIDLADANYLVNEAFAGDVYEINAKENKFGCFVATPLTALRSSDGTITYHYSLYYIDRLTKDEKNMDLVQSDAVSVLKGIVGKLEDDNVIGIEDNYQFTLFRHKFDDWCAGAYVEVNIVVPDSDCGEYDFLPIGYEIELKELVATSNSTYNAASGTAWSKVTVNVPNNLTSISGYILTPTDYRRIFTPSAPYTGFSYVDVSVYFSENVSRSFTSNGTFAISLPSQFMKTVNVTVNVSGGGTGTGYTADDIAKRSIGGYISGSTTYISQYAFCICNVTNAYFSECRSVGSYAFFDCLSLETISFPTLNTVGSYAFAYCNRLKSIFLPNVEYIGFRAFTSTGVSFISLPIMSFIGSYMFCGCSSLKSAYLDNVQQISASAFYYCTDLETVYCPNLSYIGAFGFAGCGSLQNINLTNVTSLNYAAFQYCDYLSSVNLQRVRFIASCAFSHCGDLRSIYVGEYNSSVCELAGINAFEMTPLTSSNYYGYGSIYVPASLVDSYKAATNWVYYSNRITSIP